MKESSQQVRTPGESPDIRVMVVDDDERIRSRLSRVVDRFPGCTCVGNHESGETALAALHEAAPDVILMDINMPGMGGIECARCVKEAAPDTEVIMLTVYQDSGSVFHSLAAGASGYLLKRADRSELLDAIRQVHAGGSPMNSQIARKVVDSFRKAGGESETEKLSPREREVLSLLAEGYLYKEIADNLGLSYETVHNYIRRVYEKLQVRSRGQAVAKYFSESHSRTTHPTPETPPP
jgi:DNA-binding NarL/FixJ family response regulator